MSNRTLFTSESVTEGHPDKLADQISDAVLDAALEQDASSRVACETLLTNGLAVVTGEISSKATLDVAAIARDKMIEVGYNEPAMGIDGAGCGVIAAMNIQSPDIAQGVNESYEVRTLSSQDPLDAQGAGDQGMMFGYACTDTDDLMPAPIWFAHLLASRLAYLRREGVVSGLRPDGKTQVTMAYEDGVPVAVDTVLVSTQHDPSVDADLLWAEMWDHLVKPVLAERFPLDDVTLIVNPTGAFVLGGPAADAGLTGRKIIVDTYGGMARHGGGAFSGKDPSKVDRSAAYAARWVAKNVVAAGVATRCEVQLAYAIGMARPISVRVDAFGTATVNPGLLTEAINEVFDLRPAAIIRDLDLRRPIYGVTATYGHFGRREPEFTWERTDRAADLKAQLKL